MAALDVVQEVVPRAQTLEHLLRCSKRCGAHTDLRRWDNLVERVERQMITLKRTEWFHLIIGH